MKQVRWALHLYDIWNSWYCTQKDLYLARFVKPIAKTLNICNNWRWCLSLQHLPLEIYSPFEGIMWWKSINSLCCKESIGKAANKDHLLLIIPSPKCHLHAWNPNPNSETSMQRPSTFWRRMIQQAFQLHKLGQNKFTNFRLLSTPTSVNWWKEKRRWHAHGIILGYTRITNITVEEQHRKSHRKPKTNIRFHHQWDEIGVGIEIHHLP
jgi:hypothetical protein